MEDFTAVGHFESLDPQSRDLISKALAAAAQAYAPYSQFHVGAAVLLDDGTIVVGSNQENAAYPSGMCAERVALYAAIAHHPQRKITSLAVAARRAGDETLIPATPCGSCRQVMLEFEARQAQPFRVLMKTGRHQWVQARSACSLLPYSFGKETLHLPPAS